MPSLGDSPEEGLPQTTRSGIYYEIDALDYNEQWVPGNNRTIVTCRVLTDDAWDWVTDMVGQSYVEGGVLRRHLPEQNPFDPNQWCTRVEQIDQGEPYDTGEVDDDDQPIYTLKEDGSGWPYTTWIRYRATFEGMPFAMRTDAEADSLAASLPSKPEMLRYCVRAQRTYAREQQIPGGGFLTIDDAVAENRLKLMQTGFKTRCYGDVTYTLVRWPVANFPSEWKSLRGKVCSTSFDNTGGSGEGYAFGDRELLYVGYDDNNKYFDANEDWVADVVLHFKFCEGGWNKFLNKTGTLVEVSSDGTSSGTKPYTDADFSTLFEV